MRGQLLKELIEQNKLRLPRNTTVADFETLYTLLLEARGIKSAQDITESEERLVLTVLCRFPLPGKKPTFVSGICALLSNFAGITDSELLREKFRTKISSRFTRATALDELPLGRIQGILKRS